MTLARAGRGVPVAAFIVLLIIGPGLGAYSVNLFTLVLAYAIAVLGLDLVNGFGGLLSLGQGGFFGVGAYAVAIGLAHSSLPGAVLILIGVGASALAALPIALTVAGRGQTISALVTLAFALIVASLIGGLSITGGPTGLPVPPTDLVPGIAMTPGATFQVALICFAVLLVGIAVLRRGSGGRALAACRYNRRLAASCGVNVLGHRVACFVAGSALAAVGGGLFAYGEAFVSPDSIGLTQSVQFLMMLVIGGLGTGWGSLVGALLIAGLPGEVQSLGDWQLFGTGAISLAVLVWFRRGIAGSLEDWVAGWLRRQRPPQVPAVRAAQAVPAAEVESTDGVALVGSGLSRHFSGIAAVSEMEIAVDFGQIHGLIGPNGAGKTTMLNLLSGADRPNAGRIVFQGHDVSRTPAHVRAAHGLTRTFQHATLIPGLTTLDNVLLGAHKRIGRRIRSALASVVGLSRVTEAERQALAVLADLGLDHVATQPGDVLTAGQRRLVEVARCVMSGGRVLLLDEPAAGLNEIETSQLGTALVELTRTGRAILLVEHDMSLVMSVSHRVTVMERGFPLETGTPDEITASQAVVEAYLGV